MKKTFTLLLLTCFFSLNTLFSQSKSLLWEISGNGLAKPSYIYGTMHVSDKIAFHLTDSFFIALRSADIIALESNPETWIEHDYGSKHKNANNYDEDSYNNYRYSDFYTTATQINIPDVKTYASAFDDNSYLINGYLYRYDDNRGDYAEETYLDLFIFQSGKKLNKRIEALENEQDVLKLLQKAYEPDKDEEGNQNFIEQRKMLDALQEDGTSLYEQIDEAYRNGDLEKMDSLELITIPSKNYKKYFIIERNRNMMRKMDSLLQSGNVLFTGIGAAHLPGEEGALNMLRSMGYTVTPVKGKITGKSIKEKDKIDAMYFVQTNTKQFVEDSLFSVSSPGKLYNIEAFDDNKFYLFPDMANSAYYSILRIKHHAAFKSMQPADIKTEINNLLFENIPGDIQSNVEIQSNTGLQGFDIVSKTKRGNYLRFNIFISPLETIIFKAGGIGDFVVKSKETQTFFSSIQFKKQTPNTWTNYSPTWGLFSLQFPSLRTINVADVELNISSSQTICSGEASDATGFYWFSTYYLNDDEYIEEDSFELVRISDIFVEQFKKNKFQKQNQSFKEIQQHPAMEAVYTRNGETLHTQVLISGPYYIIMAAISTDEKSVAQYFNSLVLKPFQYNKNFAIYNDTALHFSVNTIIPIVDTLLTFDDINYNSNYNYGSTKNDEDKSYLSQKKTMIFYSEASPENISVSYYKYHKFISAPDKDAYWLEIDSEAIKYLGMNISRRKFSEKDGVYNVEYLLTDTASTRAIFNKMIVVGDVVIQASTCIDTLVEPSLFIRYFYNSLKFNDTAVGLSIFESRSDLFFSQLNDTDSLLNKQAINSIDVVELNEKDADRLMLFIKSPAFKKLELETRESFIFKLASLKKPDVIIPFLKNMYIEAGDTSTIQLAVLYGLATIKTQASLKTLSELLYIETPLAKKGSSLTWIFNPLNDSLELVSKLYPQLFDFTGLPEYQYATYRWLALISKSDSSKVSLVMSQKKQLIAEASAELKRFIAGNEVDTKYSYNSYSNQTYFPKLRDITKGGSYYDYRSNYGYDDYSSINYTQPLSSKKYPKSNYSWTTNLLDYYTILLTYFYDDPAVKKYFTKIYDGKDNGLIYRTSLTLLKNNLPVADSVWSNLLENREWRYFTVKQLQKLKQENKLDTAFTSQLKIAEGCLYQYEFQEKTDSISFVSKVLVDTKNGSGYIYFFKSKMGKDKAWNLDCVGLQPEDQSQFEIEPIFVDYGGVILDDVDLQKKIDAIIKNIELLGRQRVHIASENDYNYYDDY